MLVSYCSIFLRGRGRLPGMAARKSRNAPSKGGPKRRPVDEKQHRLDLVRIREQWDVAYAEWAALVKAVKRHGRVQVVNDRRWANPEVAMRDKAASHLLAVSRAYADLLGLPAEREGKVVAVKDFQDRAKAERLRNA